MHFRHSVILHATTRWCQSRTNPTKSCSYFLCSRSPDSVRLVNGTSLCSGRLEVRSNQSDPSWTSVCEADFDQQDAEVTCRQLGCGAPSVLQGELYGNVEAPLWTREFQCAGNESALLECRSSDAVRNSCSPGKSVGLTCSGRREAAASFLLVGEASRCAGTLEMKHQGNWRPAYAPAWTLKEAAVACRELHCGSAVSTETRHRSSYKSVWWIQTACVQSGYVLRECVSARSLSSVLQVICSGKTRHFEEIQLVNGIFAFRHPCLKETCTSFDFADLVLFFMHLRHSVILHATTRWCQSRTNPTKSCSYFLCSRSPDSVRLVNGTSLCSGRLEVRSNQSDPSWTSVCEADFDQQDAEVTCRQLGCGAPSVLQGALYGHVEAPVWTREFQCAGNESALLECRSSDAVRNSCSPGKSVGLTCSGRSEAAASFLF
uniref:SRCR domain-containing protein n=1 Tax=Mastacembelus armatus TaxID=205130 RepID=A0A3Q3LPN8_9TELE